MPTDTRALTRASRDRAKAAGTSYTKARGQLLWIQRLLDDGEFDTREEADAHVCDPANQLLCGTCEWTRGMICPECAKGCGCSYNCSGWRHDEFGPDDFADDEERHCGECGGVDDGSGYGCSCGD